jgi:hypothetical protein
MIKLMKLPALALLGSVPIGHVLAAQMNSDSLRQSLRNRGIVSASRSARAPSSEPQRQLRPASWGGSCDLRPDRIADLMTKEQPAQV